jgi:hypothetical protein
MRIGGPGRPLEDRHAISRAFVAKAVLNLGETRMLIERLHADATLRRLCGWERASELPSWSTLSRAFAELAEGETPEHMHAALVKATLGQGIVGHISIDATAIEAREKPVKVEQPQEEKPKRKRGRPNKGEVVPPKEPRRLEQQATMTLSEMLADLPVHCSVGTKRNAKGYKTSWIGYKLHIATADGDIPVACLLTGARARQPSRDPAHDDGVGTGDQPLRSDGQRLRRARDRRAQPRARACADHRASHAARREGCARGGGAPSGRPATSWPRTCATTSAAPPSASTRL